MHLGLQAGCSHASWRARGSHHFGGRQCSISARLSPRVVEPAVIRVKCVLASQDQPVVDAAASHLSSLSDRNGNVLVERQQSGSTASTSSATASRSKPQVRHKQSVPQQKPATTPQAAEVKQQQQQQQQPRQVDYELVDTGTLLNAMLEELRHVKCIALDCEGVKLGDNKEGKLSLMQISAVLGGSELKGTQQQQQQPVRIWLVDVTVLGWRSIHYRTADRMINLRALMEDRSITKLMFDVRSDSTQLFREYGVHLRGVYDLQLAEVAHRQLQQIPTAFLLPLTKTLGKYVKRLPNFEKDMLNSMEVSKTYHYGNKTEIWEQRPLAKELQEYAACDVRYLHALANAVNKKLPKEIIGMVHKATVQRIMVPSPPGIERATAPTILKKSDLRRLLKPRGQQQAQRRKQQGKGSSSSVEPPLSLAEIMSRLIEKQQALSVLAAPLAGMGTQQQPEEQQPKQLEKHQPGSPVAGTEVGQHLQQHPGEQQQEVQHLTAKEVEDSVYRLLDASKVAAQAFEAQQQQAQEREQKADQEQQPQGAQSSAACMQAVMGVLEALEATSTALSKTSPLKLHQQLSGQLQELQLVQSLLQGLLGHLKTMEQAQGGPNSTDEADVEAREVHARVPPPLLLLSLEESGKGQEEGGIAATGTKPFILKPRKRQPGEPELTWLWQQEQQQQVETVTSDGNRSGDQSGGVEDGSASGDASNVSKQAPSGRVQQGSDEAASASSNGHAPDRAAPFLLWTPADLERRKQQEAIRVEQLALKRPVRMPPVL